MKLNSKNYHQANSLYLTSSKINAYLTDPYYYYEKHVLKTLEDEKTDALLLGSAVDCYITKGKKAFNRLFKPVTRRTNVEGLKYTEMTQASYQEAVTISERVMATQAFKELDGFERQVVLEQKDPLWVFEEPMKEPAIVGKGIPPLCGMLDFLKVENEKAIIVDLKTARTADPKKYYYHAQDYGYFIQAAVYTKLVRVNYPQVKTIDFYHLVVSKENKNLYQVQTFKFDTNLIEQHITQVNNLILEISLRKEWQRKDSSFKDAILLGATAVMPAEWSDGEEV